MHTQLHTETLFLSYTHSCRQNQTISIHLGCSEEVIRIPSHSTRAPIRPPNYLAKVLTGFPSQSNSSSDWLGSSRGQTETWEVRGVTIVRNKEGEERERKRRHAHTHMQSHTATETGDRWLSWDRITQRGEQRQCVLSSCRGDIHEWPDK